MKIKSLVLTVTLAVAVMFKAGAADASLFTYNKSDVNKQMTELNKVEGYVNTHTGVTLDQLKAEKNSVIANVNLTNNASTFSSMNDGPLGIPSFVWGCVLNWVGILLVYLISQDTDETKKALWGCLVGSAIGLIFYIIVFVAFATTGV